MHSDISYSIWDLQLEQEAQLPAFLIYCVGYETRSAFVSTHKRWSKVQSAAIIYRDRRVGAFAANLARAVELGHEQWSDERLAIERSIMNRISDLQKLNHGLTICVDVSAMDRGVMASVLLSIIPLMREVDRLEVVYAPSAFADRGSNLLPIRRYGAVHPTLASHLTEPMSKKCLILGLGFEYGVALSILDSIDPDYALIYVPKGLDSRFDDAVRRANFDFDLGSETARICHYPLGSIKSLSDSVASAVNPIIHSTKIVMAPLGPKIFSAVCIIHAILNRPHIAVLRYSIVSDDQITDVLPSGEIVGLVFCKTT